MKVKGSKRKDKNNVKKEWWEKWAKFISGYARIITYVYLLFIIVLSPFYAPQGYVDIGINKFRFFRTTGIICFVMLVPAAIVLLLIRWKKREALKLSVTDKAVLLYGASVIVSFACTAWKEDALWGTEGWYMGTLTQLMFVATYFAVSGFMENEKIWYSILLAVSFLVFLLGLLNRFSVYPLQMEGANPIFISTLGNINWFCSYWMVVFPIGLVLYWLGEGDTALKKGALLIYIVVGFMTGIVQGSSSGFLALGAMLAVLFCLSFRTGEKLLRWLELMLLFSVSAFLISVLKSWFPNSLNYQDIIEEKITEFSSVMPVLSTLVVCYAVMHYLIKRKKLIIKKFTFLRNTIVGMVFAMAIAIAGLIVYYSVTPEAAQNSQIAQAFVIDSDWGNSRGTTWKAGVEAFRIMTIGEKLVGIGPDCFHKYVYSVGEIANLLYDVFGEARLTNAHNEWLTILINMGICGFLTYASIFITAVLRQLKAVKNKEIVLVSMVCIISYIVHNMVSFQQVICTPVVFILLGIGERIVKKI